MEFIVLLIMVVILYFLLIFIFDFNIKKLKSIGEDKELDKLTQKYPENVEICKEYLKMLNNESVVIEEDKNSSTTLFLVMSNKIFIADLKDSYTRIQTIAHECLHSIQSKKMLWFNFIFSNVYLMYFFVFCILGVCKLVPYKMLFLSIFMILGFVFFAVRSFLENDAMIKARFLAKEYMQNKMVSTADEIDLIVKKFDVLNDIGIKCTNFQLLANVFFKIVVLLVIFVVF